MNGTEREGLYVCDSLHGGEPRRIGEFEHIEIVTSEGEVFSVALVDENRAVEVRSKTMFSSRIAVEPRACNDVRLYPRR